MAWKKYLAELLGAFTLTTGVSLGVLGYLPLPVPVVAGLILGLFVYTVGKISGAHLNPAVTIGLFSIKKISARDTALYVVAQVIGALIAWKFVYLMTQGSPQPIVENTLKIGIAEALGAFFLAFGVASVVHKKVEENISGIVVGSSLLVGILTAVGFSNAAVNPAVAIGIGSISVAYLIGPIVGAVIAMQLYQWLSKK